MEREQKEKEGESSKRAINIGTDGDAGQLNKTTRRQCKTLCKSMRSKNRQQKPLVIVFYFDKGDVVISPCKRRMPRSKIEKNNLDESNLADISNEIYRLDVNSPDHNDASPDHHDDLPDHNDDWPVHNDASPDHSDGSPVHNDASPDHNDASPDHNDASVDINMSLEDNQIIITLQNERKKTMDDFDRKIDKMNKKINKLIKEKRKKDNELLSIINEHIRVCKTKQ
ncbi:unnamed protein product [Rotaria magnacalcarata]|uniref:Uncharacterized protein n=1 Tax=Rotaria magnacalcarata TaxID=392030 RepID=A0A816W638_9BILA|nr:unnamed protein product [Rotaria magnacalcarata]